MQDKVKKLIPKKDIDTQIKDLIEGKEKSSNEFICYMVEEFTKNNQEQIKLTEYLQKLTEEHNKVNNQLLAIIAAKTSYIKDIKVWLEKENK